DLRAHVRVALARRRHDPGLRGVVRDLRRDDASGAQDARAPPVDAPARSDRAGCVTSAIRSARGDLYPGDPGVQVTPALTIGADGVDVALVTCGSHTGTHLDAP